MKLPVPRRIPLQHPELDLAQLLVKGERLVLESIQVDAQAVVSTRVVFDRCHDASADALAAKLLRQPELGDVDPPPPEVAKQPSDNAVTGVADEDGEWNLVRVADDGAVELEQALAHHACVVGPGSFFELDPKFSHGATRTKS